MHEHRAPTDESVRLLKEMEEKAAQKLIATVRLQDNTFNATCHVFHHPCEMRVEFIVRFSLNGREYEIKSSEDQFELSRLTETAAQKMHKAVIEKLAALITLESFQCASRNYLLK